MTITVQQTRHGVQYVRHLRYDWSTLEAMAHVGTAQLGRLLVIPRRHCRHCGVELEDRPGPGRPPVWCEAHRTAIGRRPARHICAGCGVPLDGRRRQAVVCGSRCGVGGPGRRLLRLRRRLREADLAERAADRQMFARWAPTIVSALSNTAAGAARCAAHAGSSPSRRPSPRALRARTAHRRG